MIATSETDSEFDVFIKELRYVAQHNGRLLASDEWRGKIAEAIVVRVREISETQKVMVRGPLHATTVINRNIAALEELLAIADALSA